MENGRQGLSDARNNMSCTRAWTGEEVECQGRRRRNDRAFAEFEAMMRGRAKASGREIDAGRAHCNGAEQTGPTAALTGHTGPRRVGLPSYITTRDVDDRDT